MNQIKVFRQLIIINFLLKIHLFTIRNKVNGGCAVTKLSSLISDSNNLIILFKTSEYINLFLK